LKKSNQNQPTICPLDREFKMHKKTQTIILVWDFLFNNELQKL